MSGEVIDKATLEEIRRRAGITVIAEAEELLRVPNPERTLPYTCAEIGRELGKHPDTIFKWFKDEPGVIVKNSPAKRMKDPKTHEWKVKHKHTSLLIPVDVYMYWLRKHARKD